MIFDSEQLLSLLKADNRHFNRISAKMIVDGFDVFSQLFFDVIFKDNHNPDLMLFARQRFPSLNKGFEQAEAYSFHEKFTLFARYAEEHALFLDKLSEYIETVKTISQKKAFISQLAACFDGIIPDLQQRYSISDLPESIEIESDRQLMIFITGHCNLSCSYCFSKDSARKEMPASDFETVLQWAKANHVKKLSLCGGEPLVHSQFDELLELINKYDFTVYFASNMTVDCTQFDYFRQNIIDKIFIHITDQTLKNKQFENQLFANVEYAERQGIELAFRGNIYDENTEWEEWFQVMRLCRISDLNIALTFPAKSAHNQFVSHNDFSKYTSDIVEIIKKAEEINISLSFAKPVPLCIFDDAMGSYLLARHKFQPLCNVYEQQYACNISINCDMQFNPCLGVTGEMLPFTTQTTWGELEGFCQKVIKPLLSKPLYEKCDNCFLYARKLCQGACLSYKSV